MCVKNPNWTPQGLRPLNPRHSRVNALLGASTLASLAMGLIALSAALSTLMTVTGRS